jgi:hypothetical protein
MMRTEFIQDRLLLRVTAYMAMIMKRRHYKSASFYRDDFGRTVHFVLESPYGHEYSPVFKFMDCGVTQIWQTIVGFCDSREILFRQFRPQNIRIHPGYYFDEETFSIVSVAAGGAS